MGKRGKRFVSFLKLKLRQRKGEVDDYRDTDFARELGLEYSTLKRWLGEASVERVDIDNLFPILKKYGDEFIRYMEAGE